MYSDEEIEDEFVYQMPEDLAARFEGGPDTNFDMLKVYEDVMKQAERPKKAVDLSLLQHKSIIQYAAGDYWDAVEIINALEGDINFRVKIYAKCMAKTTDNYRTWLQDEYTRRLKTELRHDFNAAAATEEEE